MKILDQGIVYDAASAPVHRRFCAFTNVTVLSDGRILVAFHAGSAKEAPDENVLMRLSADGGRTWEAVCDGLPPLTVDGKLGSWHHGRVDRAGAGASARRVLVARPLRSRPADDQPGDDGHAAEPHLPDGFVRRRPHVDQPAGGGHAALPVRRADGRAAGAGRRQHTRKNGVSIAVVSEAWKTYDDAGYGEHSGILSISHDGGYTFEPSVAVAHDPANRLLFWDERLAVDPETGRLVGMFWTHDREAGQDRNAHIAWAKTLDGTSWTYPIDAGFAGQIPRPLPLPGGRLLCVYVHRHRPPSLRAILSPDFGQTWDAAGELVFYEHPFGPQAGMDVSQRGFTDYYADQRLWNFGHVEPGLLPDGSVFVAFYAGDAQSLSVRWVRIQIE